MRGRPRPIEDVVKAMDPFTGNMYLHSFAHSLSDIRWSPGPDQYCTAVLCWRKQRHSVVLSGRSTPCLWPFGAHILHTLKCSKAIHPWPLCQGLCSGKRPVFSVAGLPFGDGKKQVMSGACSFTNVSMRLLFLSLLESSCQTF